MRNYCADCDVILSDPIEFRFGICADCLAIRLEKEDNALDDYWFDDNPPN